MVRRVESLAPLVEPIPIADVFATGMAPVEHCGEYVRLLFFSDHSASNDGPPLYGNADDHVIVARVVMPTGAFNNLIRMISGVPVLLD